MSPNETGVPDSPEGPWNPGIGSQLTRNLMALATIFRADNVFNDLDRAIELRDVTGLPLEDLAVFRPERLALHEILVRVTADFEVPDPETASIRSLGVNSRQIVQTLLARVVEPSRSELVREYDRLRGELAAVIADALSATRAGPPRGPGAEPPGGAWGRLRTWMRTPAAAPPARESDWDRDERCLREWTLAAESDPSPVRSAALRALVKAASAVRLRQGRIPPPDGFLGPLATDLACNAHAGAAIAHLIEPRIREVAQDEGFRPLPAEERPVLMVIKGASASGKSTMRPLQHALAARMGLHWSDFALVSPDIWRRMLLDFDALGPLHKHAGMLTGHEVDIVDKKLDSYLVRKGEQGLLPHLLIDRFRFDSFALDSEESRNLVSRFGRLLCYVFMITPPHETVERAWRRGLELGRYKAVDDLLAHNVEAFTGMQNILLGRATTASDALHFEFLDNDVPRGATPLSVAFGWGGEMNVLDVRRVLDVCRYQKINVDAKSPAEVYPRGPALAPERNAGFLLGCVRGFPRLNIADRRTGRIYARFSGGRLDWSDAEPLQAALADPDTAAALRVVAPDLSGRAGSQRKGAPVFLSAERFPTLGRWGPGMETQESGRAG